MTDTLTHAITERQPRAWVAAAGYCPVLIADTRPPMEREGQLIGIHASQHWISGAEMTALEPALGRKVTGADSMAAQSRGALVGVARLVGVVCRADHPLSPSPNRWIDFVRMVGRSVTQPIDSDTCARIRPWWRSSSKWGLLLSDAVLLPEPIPMRGAGGVWRLPAFPGRDAATGRLVTYCPAERALEQWRKARGAP